MAAISFQGAFLVLTILYAALTLFLAGNAFRIARVALLPAHLRWDLYPIPRGPRDRVRHGGSHFEESGWWLRPMPVGRAREFRAILEEVFLLRTVWRHNRSLWLWSWLLHAGLYLMTAAFLLTVWGGVAGPGASPGLQPALSALSWVFALCGFAGACGLCLRRVTSPLLRRSTSPAGWFHLSLLTLLFGSALVTMTTAPEPVSSVQALALALVRASPAPALSAQVTAHLCVLAFFIAYFPFTHMTHAYMKYFTFHAVRWDDGVRQAGPSGVGPKRSLGRSVGWAAPHIRREGEKTWREIAGGGKERDGQ